MNKIRRKGANLLTRFLALCIVFSMLVPSFYTYAATLSEEEIVFFEDETAQEAQSEEAAAEGLEEIVVFDQTEDENNYQGDELVEELQPDSAVPSEEIIDLNGFSVEGQENEQIVDLEVGAFVE